MFTRRIFDGVILTALALHLAVGLPVMWARTAQVTNPNGLKGLVGRGTLQVLS